MKTIIVFGEKTFKISVPDESRISFGPWSPPSAESKYGGNEKALSGTLRVYEGKSKESSVLAVFSGVKGYRDMSLGYEEEVAREEGAIIWKSDKDGYKREEKVKRTAQWTDGLLPSGEESDEG